MMAKMRTSHIQLVTLLEDSLRFAGVPPRALAPLTTYKIKVRLASLRPPRKRPGRPRCRRHTGGLRCAAGFRRY